MKNQTTKANKKQINRSTKHCNAEKKQKSRKTAKTTNQQRTTPRIIKKWSPKSKNGGQIRSKIDQKWSQEEVKIESERARWPKTAPESPREPEHGAMVPKLGLWCPIRDPFWKPKSTKINGKIDWKINDFLNRCSFRFVFDFWWKNDQKTCKN